MIRNIIFDYGAVLVDWNPHHLFDPYFGDPEKTSWFLGNICTMQWNSEVDCGKPMAEAVAQLQALHPEWAKEIDMYFSRWIEMMGGEIPGMYELVSELKENGFGVYGLTNWSSETFCQVRHRYPIFDLMDGMVVSGEEHVIKPDAAIFRILLERYSLEASECLFTDDNPANVTGARAVGLQAVLFESAPQLRKALREMGVTTCLSRNQARPDGLCKSPSCI